MKATYSAAIYARVSTDDQAREGTSLDTQRERCRAFILAKGWNLSEEYVDDGVSGTKRDRPALNKLLDECRSGAVNAIVFAKFDRFSRNRRDLENICAELDDLGVAVVSVAENIDSSTATGQAFRALLGVFANLERDMIVERMNSGLRSVASANYWPGAPAPYGFEIIKEGPRSKLVIYEPEAEFIRLAISMIVDEGASTAQTATRLNALGHKPRRAVRWTPHNIRRTLLDASLSGSWTWSRERGTRQPKQDPITLSIPQLVSLERHQDLLRALSRTSISRSASNAYPLSSGRLTGQCGNSYQGAIHKKAGRQYKCYGSAYFREDRCSCSRLNAQDTEDAVWSAVTNLLTDPSRLRIMANDFLESVKPNIRKVSTSEKKRLAARIERVEQGLATAYADRYAGTGDATALERAIEALETELSSLRPEKARLISEESQGAAVHETIDELSRLCEVATKRLKSMSLHEKCVLLDLLHVKTSVTGWRQCGYCYGRGKVAGKLGGDRCPACSGMKKFPDLRVSGQITNRITDVLNEENVGDIPDAVLRHYRYF